MENLRRNDLINKINSDLNTKLGLNKDEYKLAGVLILFNNLLQSLFKSQNFHSNNFPDKKLYPYYDSMIDNAGGIDIQILGIGTNGHIAFNEPGTPRNSKTRIVDLTENTIKDNSRFFDSIDEVPTQAMTMGIDTIMKAKTIYLIAQGEHKRDILEKAVYGELTPEVPASFLQEHPNCEVFYSD